MFVPSNDFKNLSFKGHTLALPAVSIGNVGQLCIDLHISTLLSEIKFAGFFHSPYVLPFCGPNAFKEDGNFPLTTPIQVYSLIEEKIIFLQMRSSVITPFRKEFVQQLLEWFQSEEMEKLILLSSSDLGNYLQERLLQSPFRCLCSASFTKSLGAKSSLLKNFWPDLKEDNFFTEINQYKNSRLPFSIGGITRTLYEECEKKNLSLVILIMFCAEGDNASEAFRFAQQMDAWLELRRKYQRKNRPLAEWNAPISWTAFYGSAASEIIY